MMDDFDNTVLLRLIRPTAFILTYITGSLVFLSGLTFINLWPTWCNFSSGKQCDMINYDIKVYHSDFLIYI